jgi:general secretion pathway protein N
MRRRHLLAIGIGIFATGLLVWAPATIVDAQLKRATDGRLRLSQAQGTIWAGSGLLELRDVRGSNAIAKDFAWRVLPDSLWRGRLVCEVTLENQGRPFLVSATISKVSITNAEINLPAAAMALAEPRLKPLKLSGNVALRTTNVAMGTGEMLGNVTLQWRNAGSAFTPVSPIGSYELQLNGEGKSASAMLSTLQGPLQLDGSGAWTIGQNPQFQATVRVPPQYQEQFTPLLRLISVQRDQDTFELQLK